ncbi:MAG: hypothetical protein VYE22_06100 [Myxococcota bacterium]|nr:hypothetical protein [Myxococcota bacterium]
MTIWQRPGTRRVLVANDHFEIVDDGAIVWARRTSAGYDTPQQVSDVHADVVRILDRLPRDARQLFLDLRRATGRNDPEFERALAPHRKRFLHGWVRTVILVRSQVGRMQVQRHGQDDGGAPIVVTDPAEAARLLGVDAVE